MKFFCAHCQQELEADDAWAGHELACPSCEQTFRVPQLPVFVPISTAPPPAPATTRPPTNRAAAQSAVSRAYRPPTQPRRNGSGIGQFVLFLIVLVAGGFCYASYRWHESPQQVWNRIVQQARAMTEPTSVPAPVAVPAATPAPDSIPLAEPESTSIPAVAPSPSPMAEATPIPTSEPIADPVAWLIQHREAWPREVTLLRPAQLEHLEHGVRTGSVTAKKGTQVQVTQIEPGYVSVSQGGASQRLPMASTDFAARAPEAIRVYLERGQMLKSREDARQRDDAATNTR